METYLLIGLILFAGVSTAVIYYNTIITKKWRNQIPNEVDCWKLEIFYYNPLDSRIVLPKRSGLGITFNFAKPVSVIVTVALLLIIILLIISKIK